MYKLYARPLFKDLAKKGFLLVGMSLMLLPGIQLAKTFPKHWLLPPAHSRFDLPLTAETTQTKYDFYRLLAHPEQVPKTSLKPLVGKIKTTSALNYELSIATYSHYQDANRRKAELVLLGYQPVIRRLQKAQLISYQVVMPEAYTLTQARAMQAQLEADGITSRLESVPVKISPRVG
jgi:hypothetical protein